MPPSLPRRADPAAAAALNSGGHLLAVTANFNGMRTYDSSLSSMLGTLGMHGQLPTGGYCTTCSDVPILKSLCRQCLVQPLTGTTRCTGPCTHLATRIHPPPTPPTGNALLLMGQEAMLKGLSAGGIAAVGDASSAVLELLTGPSHAYNAYGTWVVLCCLVASG